MKKILLLLGFLSFVTCLMAQPVNDDCGGIIDLGEAPICPIVLDTFNNVDATESVIASDVNFNIPICFNGGNVDRDVWFKFTVPSDGSIVDFTVTLTGVDGPNGSILQPQIAVYRGECLLDELQELDCVTSGLGESSVIIDLLGLTPSLEYFLRINDWSASATPNSGDFVLCIEELDPCFVMGEADETESCAGKLVDSGGEDGDYGNSENFTFTICPTEFHQCIFMTVEEYNIENGFDNLTFYAGEDVFAPQIANLTGSGMGFELQAASDCVTVQFTSDGSVTDPGFLLTWECSADTCTIPPIISCDEPVSIPSLPFAQGDLSTCFAGNTVTTGPCTGDGFLGGEEYIFTYESPGDECIMVDITNSNTQTGVAIYNDCPNVASECIASAGGTFNAADPTINAAFLEDPGTYYIVVANAGNCTPFDIAVEVVDCPIVLPPAANCEDALSINGCGNTPSIINVAQGGADPNFFQNGVNDGCWGGPGQEFYTWFVFQVQEDGNFGFLASNSDPGEDSDIDINVWGPLANIEDVCEAAETTQPIRSTWADDAGAGILDVTGLTDINPNTGGAVTDVCEDAGGDGFVSTIPVLEGEWYVVLVNDFNGNIVNGGINMDFTFTTDGVLGPLPDNFAVTADTAVCPGELVQLVAEGGELYQWIPDPALSCINCPNPIATVTETTNFSVAIVTACSIDTLSVEVGMLQVDAGPDLTVCMNEEIQIIAGANFDNVTYDWLTGAPGTLSCTDCPDPIVTANAPAGIYEYTVTVTGPTCSFSDAMTIEILDATAPEYEIVENQQICIGDVLNIGGITTPGVSYNWTSFPEGFTSNDANPEVSPDVTTTYILEVMNGECLVPSYDSILVEVSEIPLIQLEGDTLICQGESVALSFMLPEAGVAYSWSPDLNVTDPTAAATFASPTETTTYTLTADRNGCLTQESITISVTTINVELSLPDTFGICVGESIDISAFASPLGIDVNWAPNDGSLSSNSGNEVVATPQTGTLYVASVEVPGCVRSDSLWVRVDSLPPNMAIMPADTMVCEGSEVLLVSEIYEPALYQDIIFQWSPATGQQTPDSLYNMVLTPLETTVYQRIATNGFCSDTTFATINVVPIPEVNIQAVDPVCLGTSVQLFATSDTGGEISWEPETGLSCTDCLNPVYSPMQTGSVTVTVDTAGCPGSASVAVEVINPPSVTFPADNALCLGEEIANLNLDVNPDWTYQWTSDDPDFVDTTDPSPSASPNQTSNYEVTVSNGICDPVTFNYTIFVADMVELVEPEDITICDSGTPGALSISANIPGTFTWEPAEGLSCTDCPNPTVTGLPTGSYTYTVTYENDCVELTSEVMVEVVPGVIIESINATPDTTVIYDGTEISLELDITANDPANVNYVWTPGGAGSIITDMPLIQNVGSNTTYSVTVTDEFGCTDEISYSFELLESVYDIPNAFTPGNDDTNETFQVVIQGENIIVESFQIWNRWGKMIHSGSGENHGWNGQQDGDPAAPDVYIYLAKILTPSGAVVTEKGDVTLIR